MENNIFRYNSKYNIPISNIINDETIVVYPEIIYGNPLKAKRVCRWILYDPLKRGGIDLLNSWSKSDVYCSYGTYDGGIDCKIKINVVDFNENILEIKNIEKNKKYYFIYKALLCGWTQELLNNEIIYLQSIGFEELKTKNVCEMNSLLADCYILISFDLNTYISNIAVLCGCLSIIKKSDNYDISYENIIKKRGCYGDIGIKIFSNELLHQSYNYEERLHEANLYREYIKTGNNIDEFVNYFGLK
jgi:hypothetical protein